MSIALMREAWHCNIASGPKLVLILLCDFASDDGLCYPSLELLASRSGMEKRSVLRHLADLEACGILMRHNRAGRANLYKLVYEKFRTTVIQKPKKGCQIDTGDSLSPVTNKTSTGDNNAPNPPHFCHPGSDIVSPITTKEPLKQPSTNQPPGGVRARENGKNLQSAHRSAAPAVAGNSLTSSPGLPEQPHWVPDWMPLGLWKKFISARAATRSPLDDDGKKLAIRHLERLRLAGQDPEAVLEQSLLNGWKGLFPVRGAIPSEAPAPSTYAMKDYGESGPL